MKTKEAYRIWHEKEELVRKQLLENKHNKKKQHELIEAWMNDPVISEANKLLLDKHVCINCGGKMHMCVDRITKKLSQYEWACDCTPNAHLMIV